MLMTLRTERLSRLVALLVLTFLSCSFLADKALAQKTARWPRFRGENGSGIGYVDRPPLKWTEADFAWRVELPGTGHSSPVIWDDKLFVTAAVEKTGERCVVCLDALHGKV